MLYFTSNQKHRLKLLHTHIVQDKRDILGEMLLMSTTAYVFLEKNIKILLLNKFCGISSYLEPINTRLQSDNILQGII